MYGESQGKEYYPNAVSFTNENPAYDILVVSDKKREKTLVYIVNENLDNSGKVDIKFLGKQGTRLSSASEIAAKDITDKSDCYKKLNVKKIIKSSQVEIKPCSILVLAYNT
ncbi:MAG: hypothetical protein HQL32_11950 [Planctomycetes bacterium]|nr:hypothetical protein [Planctomycetota bacterium]